MTSPSGRVGATRRSRPGSAQWLLGLLLVLAIGASVAMIFTPDRSIVASLAVIAALWAAVIGAILVTKFRRQADTAESKTRDLRIVYELQLEREINARKQYELGVEAQVRREVRAESGAELRELQEQVASLRSSLELLIGDLPEDRVALEAERLRELEAASAAAVQDDAAAEQDFARAAPPTAARPPADDAPTDQWARISDAAPGESVQPIAAEPSFAAPEPRRPAPQFSPPSPAAPPPQHPAGPAHGGGQPRAGGRVDAGPRPTAPRDPEPGHPSFVPAPEVGRHGRRRAEDTPAAAAAAVPADIGATDIGPTDNGPTDNGPAAVTDPAAGVDDTIADATAAWATSTSSPGRDRHRAPETTPGAHSNGRSVSDLMDQFTSRASGGRRRRRED